MTTTADKKKEEPRTKHKKDGIVDDTIRTIGGGARFIVRHVIIIVLSAILNSDIHLMSS